MYYNFVRSSWFPRGLCPPILCLTCWRHSSSFIPTSFQTGRRGWRERFQRSGAGWSCEDPERFLRRRRGGQAHDHADDDDASDNNNQDIERAKCANKQKEQLQEGCVRCLEKPQPHSQAQLWKRKHKIWIKIQIQVEIEGQVQVQIQVQVWTDTKWQVKNKNQFN